MLKRFYERWFRMKNKQEAVEMKRKLSLFYAFVGWNAFIVIFYLIMKKEMPEDPDERRLSYRSLLPPATKMHVYQISGLTLSNDFEIAYKSKVAQIEKENKENANAKTDEN